MCMRLGAGAASCKEIAEASVRSATGKYSSPASNALNCFAGLCMQVWTTLLPECSSWAQAAAAATLLAALRWSPAPLAARLEAWEKLRSRQGGRPQELAAVAQLLQVRGSRPH